MCPACTSPKPALSCRGCLPIGNAWYIGAMDHWAGWTIGDEIPGSRYGLHLAEASSLPRPRSGKDAGTRSFQRRTSGPVVRALALLRPVPAQRRSPLRPLRTAGFRRAPAGQHGPTLHGTCGARRSARAARCGQRAVAPVGPGPGALSHIGSRLPAHGASSRKFATRAGRTAE